MSETVLVRANLPIDVVAWASQRAEATGLTLTDIIIEAMLVREGRTPPAKMRLLMALSARTKKAYGGTRFPPDVTLKVMEFITTDPKLKSLYDEAVNVAEEGKPDPTQRANLHRAIGSMVKSVLGAKVFGRSNPVDPSVHLIESHALLAP